MAALHRKIDSLNRQIAELVSVLKLIAVAHAYRFEGRPDCNNDTSGDLAPVCVPNCPACLKEAAIAKYGVL
jgi:hypothetical protein